MDLDKLSKKELVDLLEQQSNKMGYSDHELEISKIDNLARASNPNQIPFRETSDHKNIMLWTDLNKPVGPLSPDNARSVANRWKRAGYQLYTTKRTDAQIEAYKKTAKYKLDHEKHLAQRKLRKSQSAKGKNDNLVKDIAVAVAQANRPTNE